MFEFQKLGFFPVVDTAKSFQTLLTRLRHTAIICLTQTNELPADLESGW